MTVQAITSIDEFHQLINGDKPIVIDFWATWCGPCRVIGPIFEQLSSRFGAVGFYKVDVDEQQAISEEVGIRAMPTFIAFHKGNKVTEVMGAAPTQLEALITKAASLA